MERVDLEVAGLVETAQKAAAVLRAGGIVLYPTDTLYGLAVAADNEPALQRLMALKGREEGKTLSIAVADMAMAKRYAVVTPLAEKLAERYLPGALTLVLNAVDGLSPEIRRADGTVAIRIPDSPFCIALAHELGGAYTATSANLAGKETVTTVEEILAQFGVAADSIALAVDGGTLPASIGSTIADARGEAARVIRQGALQIG